jgi:tRNA uridine 5-carbamoylmethylation protein Kti12
VTLLLHLAKDLILINSTNNQMPTVYILVGVPGSGKSTWYRNQDWLGQDKKDHKYVSTDQHVEGYARDQGKTYNEVFEEYMPTAVKQMMVNVNMAAAFQMDIVWDQTSTTVKSRRKKFVELPNYKHIAVVFKTPEPDELSRRLASRPGKVIPDEVVQNMINNFEMPTSAEGYEQIWIAQ